MKRLLSYMIVCPLVFLAGFVDAVAGGGGLISLPAYLLSGMPVHMAIGTNKLSSGMGTAVATYRFARSGYIRWRLALLCAVAALVGSNVGARITLLIPDDAFQIVMLVILPLTAGYVLWGGALRGGGEKPPFSRGKTAAIACSTALVVGVYDGFYGPGTGTFLILLLTGAAHLALSEANGVAKVINLSTNVSALAVFLLHGKVLLPLGLAAGCFSIAGNYLGTRFFSQKGADAVKPTLFACFAAGLLPCLALCAPRLSRFFHSRASAAPQTLRPVVFLTI